MAPENKRTGGSVVKTSFGFGLTTYQLFPWHKLSSRKIKVPFADFKELSNEVSIFCLFSSADYCSRSPIEIIKPHCKLIKIHSMENLRQVVDFHGYDLTNFMKKFADLLFLFIPETMCTQEGAQPTSWPGS